MHTRAVILVVSHYPPTRNEWGSYRLNIFELHGKSARYLDNIPVRANGSDMHRSQCKKSKTRYRFTNVEYASH